MSILSTTTRKELERRRELLVEELTALDVILRASPPTNGVKQKQGSIRRGLAQRTGFRDKVREILAANPQGLKPAEVTKALEESGVTYTGTTKFSLRVSNDLNRMLHAGELHRTNSGRYKLSGG